METSVIWNDHQLNQVRLKESTQPYCGWASEILHHQKDGWNPIDNGMFTTYQMVMVIRISQPSTVSFEV